MGRREGCLGSVLLCPVLQGYQAVAIQSHSDLIQYTCSHQHFNIASAVIFSIPCKRSKQLEGTCTLQIGSIYVIIVFGNGPLQLSSPPC